MLLPSGITALVGPNGSGKSNVVDAVRWCLGEQSMRDLRGQKAEDVIYAGPRRSAGVAEVTLAFEARSVDGPGPAEVSVARRLYRSGESEYLLNGARVRLRDVQDALRSIGVDSSRSVVVNQGMADALLTATPVERRALLEHAAGLSTYRARRDEARGKLTTTVQNVQTIEVVLAELEPRLRILRRQARAVRERDDAQARLDVRLKEWYGFRWTTSRGAMAGLEEECACAERERHEAEAALHEHEKVAHDALQRERAWQREIAAARDGVHALQREHDAARFALKEAQQQIASLAEAVRTGRTRKAAAESARGDLHARLDEAREAANTLARKHAELDVKRREVMRELNEVTPVAHGVEQRLGVINREYRQARDTYETLSAGMQKDIRSVEFGQSRLDSLRHDLERQANELDRMEREVAAARARAAAAAERSQGLREDALESETRVAAAKKRLERLDHLRSRLRQALTGWERRSGVVAATVANLRSYAGDVLDRVEVPYGWERAVAAALAAASGVLASHAGVETWESEWRTSFDGWRRNLEGACLGRGAWADEIVLNVPDHLVTPLSATLLVQSEAEARTLWRILQAMPAHRIGSPSLQIVTREGAVRNAYGVDRARHDDRMVRFFEARRELTLLESRRVRWNKTLQAVEQARLDGSAALQNALDADSEVTREYGAVRQEEAEAQGLVGAITRTIDMVQAEKGRRRDEIARLEVETELRRTRVSEEGAKVHELSEQLRAIGLTRDETERERARVRAQMQAQRNEIDRLKGQGDVVEAQVEAQVRVTNSLLGQLERVEAEIERLTVDGHRLEEQMAALEPLITSRRRICDERARALEEKQALVRDLEGRESGGISPQHLSESRSRVARAVAAHERLTAALGHRHAALDALRAEIEREVGQAPEGLPESASEVPSEDEIRGLRRRAGQYADVDASVISEHDELQQRYDALSQHLQDLNEAIRGLHDIIALADREMRTRFNEAFERVNREFSRMFEVMLRGGEAELERTDEDGGIGIKAQLPGRKARSSAAFSGGERTLVAASLLFGLLHIRPTPFVVLDEVDAALDESNVDRYLAALRDIACNTQCIVVTHNRATMAAADALYGMTMDDEGASGMLSLRLDAYSTAV